MSRPSGLQRAQGLGAGDSVAFSRPFAGIFLPYPSSSLTDNALS